MVNIMSNINNTYNGIAKNLNEDPFTSFVKEQVPTLFFEILKYLPNKHDIDDLYALSHTSQTFYQALKNEEILKLLSQFPYIAALHQHALEILTERLPRAFTDIRTQFSRTFPNKELVLIHEKEGIPPYLTLNQVARLEQMDIIYILLDSSELLPISKDIQRLLPPEKPLADIYENPFTSEKTEKEKLELLLESQALLTPRTFTKVCEHQNDRYTILQWAEFAYQEGIPLPFKLEDFFRFDSRKVAEIAIDIRQQWFQDAENKLCKYRNDRDTILQWAEVADEAGIPLPPALDLNDDSFWSNPQKVAETASDFRQQWFPGTKNKVRKYQNDRRMIREWEQTAKQANIPLPSALSLSDNSFWSNPQKVAKTASDTRQQWFQANKSENSLLKLALRSLYSTVTRYAFLYDDPTLNLCHL